MLNPIRQPRITQVVEMGQGDTTVLFLHGLFGTPIHWDVVMRQMAPHYRLIAPQLPVDRQPHRRRDGMKTISDLVDVVEEFIDDRDLRDIVLCGNSLGGLASLEYCLRQPERIRSLILSGSAGLYERALTEGVRPRPSRRFIKSVMSDILYNQDLVTEEAIDEWYESVRDRDFVRFILRVSRATRDCNMENELHRIKCPTLMVWGRNDTITPPSVAETFREAIAGSELHYIDECGHAPNWEKPEQFAQIVEDFLAAQRAKREVERDSLTT